MHSFISLLRPTIDRQRDTNPVRQATLGPLTGLVVT